MQTYLPFIITAITLSLASIAVIVSVLYHAIKETWKEKVDRLERENAQLKQELGTIPSQPRLENLPPNQSVDTYLGKLIAESAKDWENMEDSKKWLSEVRGYK